MRSILAFYEMDVEYGGPENGGWYRDTGTFVRVLALHFDDRTAILAQRRANRLLDRLQQHRTPITSPAYVGGRFRAFTFSGLPPARFPAEPAR
ncbi:hypothetical protein J2Y58_003884 [Sphingomonas sp. BE138]|uniref:hypothetical protein n=1 Tax=Sphingomonas sp. BE138 TaxID=2817845 RepID=UPI002857CC6B|nr:hypothetical protein [Sphingomonas sp. BE138]MDR6790501.1 hypothetical protein [Sphingomonas sp. BE138]